MSKILCTYFNRSVRVSTQIRTVESSSDLSFSRSFVLAIFVLFSTIYALRSKTQHLQPHIYQLTSLHRSGDVDELVVRERCVAVNRVENTAICPSGFCAVRVHRDSASAVDVVFAVRSFTYEVVENGN